MKDRDEEMQTLAVLRRLKRQGVREVEWQQVGGGKLQVRAKAQVGRAHRTYTSTPQLSQLDALLELAEAVGAEKGESRRQRKPKPKARRLHRPSAGVPGPEPAEPPAQREPRRERPEKVVARHTPDRAKALPPGDRPGRGGGR